jgi:MYXO-CTERM domain-containing protein
MKMRMLVTPAIVLGLAGAAQGQIWAESGDAGALPGSAQVISGNVTTITGTLGPTPADIDMFCFNIVDAPNFVATVTVFAGASTDSQLYLFNSAGAGVAFDDDSGLGLFSMISNDHTINLGGPPDTVGQSNLITNSGNGLHYLAITRFDTDALNLAGGTQLANGIWHDGSPYAGPFAPDGPGSANPVLAGWATASSVGAPIVYTITITGVPAPGALALLGVAGLVGTRRRRA